MTTAVKNTLVSEKELVKATNGASTFVEGIDELINDYQQRISRLQELKRTVHNEFGIEVLTKSSKSPADFLSPSTRELDRLSSGFTNRAS